MFHLVTGIPWIYNIPKCLAALITEVMLTGAKIYMLIIMFLFVMTNNCIVIIELVPAGYI